MIVLGIDSGALYCGLSVIGYDKAPIYIHSEIFGIERNGTRYQDYRLSLLKAFGDKAAYLVEKYQPDIVVSEIIPVVGIGNVSAQRQLAATASTAFQTVAAQHGFACDQIAATSVKKALTGSGKATKVAVRNSVIDILVNYPDLRDNLLSNKNRSDESDAIAVSLAYGALKLKWKL